ncbi:MAG: MgtC/SapB family protein [Clostridium sp.]|uniref:MgtC/SapB family protein n=1 Tax=Clostridium sp. TaxID=1506 RepID=UPI003F39561F
MILTDFLIRLLSAAILGFLIGLERQYRQTLAGIRTNVLVCVGACLFVMYATIAGSGDSTRIAGQVVTGVGFLGGGVILREGFNVRGLNTAATLWCTASVGVLASSGRIIFAATAASIIVLANIILRPIAKKMYRVKDKDEDDEYIYGITIKCDENEEFNIRSMLMEMVSKEKILLRKLESIEIENESKVRVKAEIISIEKSDMIIERIIGVLSLEVGVVSIGWKVLSE